MSLGDEATRNSRDSASAATSWVTAEVPPSGVSPYQDGGRHLCDEDRTILCDVPTEVKSPRICKM